MGISGLLKGLQCYTHKGHIRDYSGQALAVDASSWLHKSVYSISERFVETTEAANGSDATGHGVVVDNTCVQTSTNYIMKRCQELLLHANIATIYLVMDGVRCPLKADTNRDREARRQEHLQEARRHRQQGSISKAQDKYKMCIKIRAEFAKAVIRELQRRLQSLPQLRMRIVCVWAPYEADAQLVKLCYDGLAHAIVTEDSDVLLYAATCRLSVPIIFKLDRNTGSCDALSMEWLLGINTTGKSSSTSLSTNHHEKTKAATTTSKKASTLETILIGLACREERRPGAGVRQFVQACVLAGCDYAPSCLHGIGLVTAFKLVRDQAHRPPSECFRYILSSLPNKAAVFGNANNGVVVHQDEYEELLSKSEAVFYYHPVSDAHGRVNHLLLPPSLDSTQQLELPQESLIKFLPSLTRFSDSSFMGAIQKESSQPPINLRATSHSSAPLAIVPNNKRVWQDQQQNHHRQQVSGKLSSTQARQHPAVVKVPTINPYRPAKRPRQQDTATGTNDAITAPNPFAKYSLDNTKENVPPPPLSSNLELLFQNNSQDVRFVKRQFPKVPPTGRCEQAKLPITQTGDNDDDTFLPLPTSKASSCRIQEVPSISPNKKLTPLSESLHRTRSRALTGFKAAEHVSHPQFDNLTDDSMQQTSPAAIVATTSKFFQPIPRRVTLDSMTFPQSQNEESSLDEREPQKAINVFSVMDIDPKEEATEQCATETFDYGSPSWHSNNAKQTPGNGNAITSDTQVELGPDCHIVEIASSEEGNNAYHHVSRSRNALTKKDDSGRGNYRTAKLRTPKSLLLQQRSGATGGTNLRSRVSGTNKVKPHRLSKRKPSNTGSTSNQKQSKLHNHYPLVIRDRSA